MALPLYEDEAIARGGCAWKGKWRAKLESWKCGWERARVGTK
jgi:hypothetical protein